jgi:peptide/nickel transport system substrate-binding protein
VKFVSDESIASMMLEAGEIDYIPAYVEASDIPRLSTNPEISLTDKEYFMHTCGSLLCFNTQRAPTSDINVRRAIAYAIDKQDHILKSVFGYGVFTNSVFPPNVAWAYNDDPEYIYEYNVAKANELLDNAGYTKGSDGFRFTLDASCANWQPALMRDLTVMKEEMKLIGIDLDISFTDRSTQVENVFTNHDFDIFNVLMTMGPDPIVNMHRFMTSDNIGTAPFRNIALYNNSRVDELCALATTELDISKRAEYYYEVQDIMSEEVPYINLYEKRFVSAWNNDFVGFPRGPAGATDPMHKVWWTLAEPVEEPTPFPMETVYIGVAVIGVAIGVVGIALYLRGRK